MFVTQDMQSSSGVFESVSMEVSFVEQPKYTSEQPTYYVTEQPRNTDVTTSYSFVFGLFEKPVGISFFPNQPTIIEIASAMFEDSSYLQSEDQKMLNEIFVQSLKNTPSRPRK